jgi:hypothetical protein
MNHTISLSEKTEQALRALADEQGMSEEEYLRRLIEAWGAGLPEGARDPDQAWFWTPEWQAGERAADADLTAGRSTICGSDEAFLKALEERVNSTAKSAPDADA